MYCGWLGAAKRTAVSSASGASSRGQGLDRGTPHSVGVRFDVERLAHQRKAFDRAHHTDAADRRLSHARRGIAPEPLAEDRQHLRAGGIIGRAALGRGVGQLLDDRPPDACIVGIVAEQIDQRCGGSRVGNTLALGP